MKEKKPQKISGIAAGLRSTALIHSGFPLGINPALMIAAHGAKTSNGSAKSPSHTGLLPLDFQCCLYFLLLVQLKERGWGTDSAGNLYCQNLS